MSANPAPSSSSSSSSSAPPSPLPPSFFPSPILDHASAGLLAGLLSTLLTHPLDLLRTRFQVSSAPIRPGGPGRVIWRELRRVKHDGGGWAALYRGLGPNAVGNLAGWGLYFMWYELMKRRIASRDPDSVHVSQSGAREGRLSPAGYLLASAQASALTAVLTNPLWVVRVRIFSSPPAAAPPFRTLRAGLHQIYSREGLRGLYRGSSFALVGVCNGALQFMAYEELKQLGFAWKRRRFERAARPWREGGEKLSNIEYIVMSAASKLVALATTYPYQVVRARLQVPDPPPPPVQLTYAQSGLRGFYRGLATNMIRVLPATCITFVVYENVAWAMRRWGRAGGVVWRWAEEGDGQG
ncbi:mitochondrial carrier [Calocera cornea HHB12733]|uniref:Mitochondrial carrier n=1 Tax=Calocera cornea HHB12733 TaxID=1353952 RepID=A0A165JQ84_9BASI|nr:mitochondrial carrier [Calocera cornea HHB12733]